MAGVTDVVAQYQAYGPLLASFLSNLLATFGDKGQLVIVMLSSRYDPKRVFVGAMGAFSLWSAVEVALGAWITRVLPGGLLTLVTGTLFVLFGVWTLVNLARQIEGSDPLHVTLRGSRADGAGDMSVASRYLPDSVQVMQGRGPVLTSFVFIMFAEFGDKTQLLTINLAATFPESPVAVFVGVVAALALRTGIDAIIGGQARRYLPTRLIELAAAVVFVAFGLAVFGVIGDTALIAVVALSILSAIAGAVWLARRPA